jgi:hypothetical protein
MVTDVIKKGIQKKVSEIFKLDVGSLVEKTFKRFRTLQEKAEEFGEKFGGIFDGITKAIAVFEEIVGTFRKVREVINDAADIVKWGVRALQCSGIISCLTIFIEPLKERAIKWLGEKALNICGVRYLMAKLVHGLFGTLPATIARKVLGVLGDLVDALAPSALGELSDIFRGGIKEESIPDPSEIVDNDCIGIDIGFSVLKGFKTSKPQKGTLGEKAGEDDVENLMKFGETVSAQKIESFLKLLKNMGITDDTPMSRETLQSIQSLLEKVEPEELNDLVEGKASEATATKLKPLTNAIEKLAQETESRQKSSAPATPAKPKPAAPRRTEPPVPSSPAPVPTSPPDNGAIDAPERPWDKTDLHITFVPDVLRPGMAFYQKSINVDTRLSQDRRKYRTCAATFTGSVFFFVDYGNAPHPSPFTPPAVTLKWKAGTQGATLEDKGPRYDGPGTFLRTSFPASFTVEINDKDVLEMEFTLQDRDVKLTYTDEIIFDSFGCT